MGWYDDVKSYCWDDRTTPYAVPIARMTRPQADKELFTYSAFLSLVAAVGSVAVLVQARALHSALLYVAALHAATVLWCAIVLALTKHARAARYCVSAPLAVLAGFAGGVLNPHLLLVETLLLCGFALLWLRYSLRVVAIARAYPGLPAHLPADLAPLPPARRRRSRTPAPPPPAPPAA